MSDKRTRLALEGTIAAAGFSSGDRFVVGVWEEGPLGPMTDVMWANASGRRTLLAPSDDVATFIAGIYRFDRVVVVPVTLRDARPDRLHLLAGALEIELEGGRALRLFALRPRWLARSPTWVRIENAILRPLVAGLVLKGASRVRAYGRTPSGVREWYRIDAYRPVVRGSARLDGEDLGEIAPLHPPAGFGFSEFPRRPALVRCSPLLEGAERFLP